MKRLTTKEFISKAKFIHNNKYYYSRVKYVDSYSNVTIECPIHGIFNQRANHHLQGHGCPYCTIKVTTEMFIKNATKVHANKYDYSLVKYTNKNGKVKIICKYHGTFVQLAKNHLRGQCCPRCKNYVSKPEIDFLNLVKIPQKNRQIYIGKYKVDGVNGKSIFEFLGDYWHGNPNKFDSADVNKSCGMTYGKLLDRTMHKFKTLKEMGYRINYMWESDWKRYLRNKSFQLRKY